ncbi:MAG: hypothetical protein ACREN2_08320 [Candidatus Dormibacteria bacterium]
MPTTVDITGDELVVEVRGADKIWALKSELRIPLQHVIGAESGEAEAAAWYHGIRAPGTSLPGVITAGTFYRHSEKVFWDVHHPEKAVAIQLHDENYQRLVVEVDNPAATIQAITSAVKPG